jgi:hypothetical protein
LLFIVTIQSTAELQEITLKRREPRLLHSE